MKKLLFTVLALCLLFSCTKPEEPDIIINNYTVILKRDTVLNNTSVNGVITPPITVAPIPTVTDVPLPKVWWECFENANIDGIAQELISKFEVYKDTNEIKDYIKNFVGKSVTIVCPGPGEGVFHLGDGHWYTWPEWRLYTTTNFGHSDVQEGTLPGTTLSTQRTTITVTTVLVCRQKGVPVIPIPILTYTIPTTYSNSSIIITSSTRIGAVCKDGTTSSATGSGACSYHGGVARWIYR